MRRDYASSVQGTDCYLIRKHNIIVRETNKEKFRFDKTFFVAGLLKHSLILNEIERGKREKEREREKEIDR